MANDMVLVVSTMFPNAALPVHAVFVQQRIRALSRLVNLEVCSPVPEFPLVDRVFEKYAHRSQIPHEEDQDGLRCHFPRFLSIPSVLKPTDGWFLYRCLRNFVRERGLESRLALIDAHLAFPDGWAALRLGQELDVPVTVTLRGHDINELAHTRGRRRMVQHTLRGADRVFGVARALVDGAIELGAPPERAVVSSNGVDPDRFHPVDREAIRKELGLPSGVPLVLAVGHLVERKGFHHLLEAADGLQRRGEDAHVVLVGARGEEGNFEPRLREIVRERGLTGRVHFAGAVPNPDLYRWYSAADVSCLASEKEGWPNVVLESLACGVPVVATAVWGTPEILCRDDLGSLVPWADVPRLRASLGEALERAWDAEGLRNYALEHTWDGTAAKVAEHMESVLKERGRTLPRVGSEAHR